MRAALATGCVLLPSKARSCGLHWQRCAYGEAAAGPLASVQATPVQRNAFSHPKQPAAAAAALALQRATGVENLDTQVVRAVRNMDLRRGAIGVFERVRQRLLDNSIRGQVKPGRQIARPT